MKGKQREIFIQVIGIENGFFSIGKQQSKLGQKVKVCITNYSLKLLLGKNSGKCETEITSAVLSTGMKIVLEWQSACRLARQIKA